MDLFSNTSLSSRFAGLSKHDQSDEPEFASANVADLFLKNNGAESPIAIDLPDQKKARKDSEFILDDVLTVRKPESRNPGFQRPPGDDDSESENADRKRAGFEQTQVEERQQSAIRQRYKHNAWGKAQAVYYNISDKGDYFYVWGHDRANPNNPYGPRKMSNAQLRKVLIDGILNKGWDTIYFYRHNAIDFETAQRAVSMLRMELSQTLKLAGIDDKKLATMVSFKLTDDPEPWAGPLRQLFGHAVSVKLKEWEMNRIGRARTRRENRGLWGNVATEPSGPEPN